MMSWWVVRSLVNIRMSSMYIMTCPVSSSSQKISFIILKGSQGVCETKEHNRWFKESTVGDECCFPFISLLDADILIAPMYIQFSEIFCAFEFVHKF